MNAHTIFRLAVKDLALLRRPLALYAAAGCVAVALAATHDQAARSLGITLAINVFLAACFHLVLGNVLGERERKNLAFVLSLPVSPIEQAAAKLLSSIGMYAGVGSFAAFAFVFLAPVDVFAAMASDGRGLLSHALGWTAYFALVLGGFLVPFAIVLATAVVSESLGWTIAVSTGLIFGLGNGLFLFGPRASVVAAYVRSLRTGGPALPATLAFEAAAIACTLGIALHLQSRKTSFL